MAEGNIPKIIEAANAFSTNVKMTNSSDFNDYVTEGNYLCGNTTQYSNSPTGNGDNGYLIVFAPFSDRSIQIWIGCYIGKIQIRFRTNTTWSAWTTIYQAQ